MLKHGKYYKYFSFFSLLIIVVLLYITISSRVDRFNLVDFEGIIHISDRNSEVISIDLVRIIVESFGAYISVDRALNLIQIEGRSIDLRRITERTIYGRWLNEVMDLNEPQWGFEFTNSLRFGPYSFYRATYIYNYNISTWEELIVAGFFEINNNNQLILYYLTEFWANNPYNQLDISYIQVWDIEFIAQNILRLNQNDLELILIRV